MFYYLFVIFISNLLMNMKCFEANILLNRKPNVKLVLYIFNVNVLLEVNKHTIFLFVFFSRWSKVLLSRLYTLYN